MAMEKSKKERLRIKEGQWYLCKKDASLPNGKITYQQDYLYRGAPGKQTIYDHFGVPQFWSETSAPEFFQEATENDLTNLPCGSGEPVRTEEAPIDGRPLKLFHVANKLGHFYVVAHSFDEAAEAISKRLCDASYGYFWERRVESIEEMAIQDISLTTGQQNFSSQLGNLIVVEPQNQISK